MSESEKEKTIPKLQPIGGWLYLVGLGLIVALLYALIAILNGGLGAVGMAIQLIWTGFVIYLLYLFRERSRKFVKYFIIYLILNLSFALFASASSNWNSSMSEDLCRAIVGIVIWIPYILISKRVKKTFIITHNKEQLNNNPIISYCSKCGTSLDKDSKFCANCGNKIV